MSIVYYCLRNFFMIRNFVIRTSKTGKPTFQAEKPIFRAGRSTNGTRQQREVFGLENQKERHPNYACMMTPTFFSICYLFYVERPNPHDCLSGQGQGFHSQNIHFLSHICFHFHKFQYICRAAKCVNEREREKKRYSHEMN